MSAGAARVRARPSDAAAAVARAALGDAWYAVRCFLAAVLGWWAFVLALPGDTFSTSPSYAWFARLGTERGWAAVAGTASLFCASALFYRATWWRAASSLAAAAVYAVLAYGLWRGNPLSTGTGTYTACAVLCHLLAARNASDAGRVRPGGGP